ncbi:MAG: hypothetical protein ACUVUR_08125 [bacterium]
MEKPDQSVARYSKRAGRFLPDDLRDHLLPMMAKGYADARRSQKLVDQAVQQVIKSLNVPYLYRIHYLNFGRQVWAKSRRFNRRTLELELKILQHRWQEKGLEPGVMAAVQVAVLNALRTH